MAARSDSIGFFWEDHVTVRERKEPAPKRSAPERTWLKPDWLPNYAVAAAFMPNLLTKEEFLALPAGTEFLYDVECYPNLWSCAFEVFGGPYNGKHIYFELSPWSTLDRQFLEQVYTSHTHTGFNTRQYDQTMVELAIAGLDNARLKAASDMLIVRDEETNQAMRPWEVFRYFKIKRRLKTDQIDLIDVAPLSASLKIYGARLHTPYMQDLPFHPMTFLSEQQAVILRYYNFKDLIHTRYLRHAVAPELALRYRMSKDYDDDLRSRSDAQIAEHVMRKELSRILGRQIKQPEIEPGTPFRWNDPGFLRFQTQQMQDIFETCKRINFTVGANGAVTIPPELDGLKINIGKGVYSFGAGGLHSTEKRKSYVAGGGYRILDRDVTSYYPYLILNQNLFPSHIGPQFLVVYRGIVLQRVAAKEQAQKCEAAGDRAGQMHWEGIAQSLKIVINGAYGKLGSRHSCLYAPGLLIQTTITGQLSILMLIEAMEMCHIEVISANTDGIVMRVHESQMDTYHAVLKWWEDATKFNTEETEYAALYSRDVNNYIAVKKAKPGKKPTIKSKGQYANPWSDNGKIEPWMHINPTAQVCVLAVEKLLTEGIPIQQTIRECKDMTQFVSVKTAGDGGAVVVTRGNYKNRTPSEQLAVIQAAGGEMVAPGLWRYPEMEGELAGIPTAEAYRQAIAPTTVDYIGKAVRWYYAKGRENYEIVKADNGNKVGETDGAMPCMDLPTSIPEDLDYDYYIARTEKILTKIAYA